MDLHSGRLVRRVAVLLRPEKVYVPEVLGAFELRYLVETGLAGIEVVGHGELVETVAALELLQHPDSCLDHRGGIDLEADVRRGEGHQGVELVLQLQQSRQGCPDDDSSQTVPDEGQPLESIGGKKLDHVVFDLGGQPVPHLDDVGVGEVLVGGGAEEGRLGVKRRYAVLYYLHVERVPLKAVNQDH